MIDAFIIPAVEFSTVDIPSKPFFRKTKKISLKITDMGLTFTGTTINWDEITNVEVKFFNSNPYIQLTAGTNLYSLYFENKFYYRRKRPWFGASEFITREFVKVLEEKGLFTIQKLEANILSEERQLGSYVHSAWNSLFLLVPVALVVISVAILYAGLVYGTQIQIL